MPRSPAPRARRSGLLPAALAAGALAAAGALFAGGALASADTPPAGDPAAAPPAVEDFEHPGADGVTGIKLKHGDGRIILADCSGQTQIQVWSRSAVNPFGRFCFRVTGSSGLLTVELSDVYAVQTVGVAVRAGISAEGASQTVEVAKDGFQGVGEGTGGTPAVLVELRATG
ncbi:hypothetical protein [Kitasatospora sp. NPDC058218]|uniref:hypothetical protein n=1 Tax=Kitasatospora sp. NPDC058218 TaxID=3346385 RepID=UPI0036DAD1FC